MLKLYVVSVLIICIAIGCAPRYKVDRWNNYKVAIQSVTKIREGWSAEDVIKHIGSPDEVSFSKRKWTYYYYFPKDDPVQGYLIFNLTFQNGKVDKVSSLSRLKEIPLN